MPGFDPAPSVVERKEEQRAEQEHDANTGDDQEASGSAISADHEEPRCQKTTMATARLRSSVEEAAKSSAIGNSSFTTLVPQKTASTVRRLSAHCGVSQRHIRSIRSGFGGLPARLRSGSPRRDAPAPLQGRAMMRLWPASISANTFGA
jgi:hypothetical protein